MIINEAKSIFLEVAWKEMICDTSLSYRKKIMNIMGTVTIASTSLCRYSTVAYHKILLKNKSAKKKRKRNVCLQVLFSLAKSRLTSEQGKVRRIVILAIILVCNQHVSTNPPQGGREQYYRMDNGLGADDDKKTLADKLQVASIANSLFVCLVLPPWCRFPSSFFSFSFRF